MASSAPTIVHPPFFLIGAVFAPNARLASRMPRSGGAVLLEFFQASVEHARVLAAEALYLLERAAKRGHFRLMDIDAAIWKEGSHGTGGSD